MLKSFLELNVNVQHDKSQYSIKKNKLIILNNNNSRFNDTKQTPQKHQLNNSNPSLSRCLSNTPKSGKFSNNITKSSFYKQQPKKTQQLEKPPQQIKFDCITYDYKSTNQKLLYNFLMLQPKPTKPISSSISQINFPCQTDLQTLQTSTSSQQKLSLTIIFNYDIGYLKLQQLFQQLMQIKKFQQSSYKIAHYQLRNNHISDYNKTVVTQKHKQKKDQMDNFTKQIDTCIKLDKTWKIKENIKYKQFCKKNWKEKDILNKNSLTNYQKKTNQFFICQIDQKYQINIVVLHRQKDFVLTKVEDKEIDEALILIKNSQNANQSNSPNCKKQSINIQFSSSLVQLMQSYLQSSTQIIFVSQYPNLNNMQSLQQLLRIPIKIEQNHIQQVQKIIKTYNKQKQTKLQLQVSKMKTKLRQLHYKKKQTQQNISYLMKKYKKGFQNIFDSLNYLKKSNITDLISFKENLENEIRQKEEEIRDQLKELKEINYEIILGQERNQYFREKMEILKENLEEDLESINDGMGNTAANNSVNNSPMSKSGLKSAFNDVNNDQIKSKQSTKSPTGLKSPRSPKSNATRKQNLSPKTDKQLTQAILNKFIQAQQQSQNPYSIQLQRQIDRYSNQLRQKTRQRLIKSNQVSSFHNLMQQLRKKLSRQQFTKLEQKYLGLISFC